MRILVACFSRSGHTARLADALAERLARDGHEIARERIVPLRTPGKWRLVPPLLSTVPVLPLVLGVPAFRRWWLARYPQAEQAIAPLAHPDVSRFDVVLVGGPKWVYIAYPVARYLAEVRGLEGRPVGLFATFCGPPLRVFELELLFVPLEARVARRGARVAAKLAVSSHFHEFFFLREMEWIFRGLSRLAFGRPLRSFTLGSEWAEREIGRFVGDTTAAEPARQAAI